MSTRLQRGLEAGETREQLADRDAHLRITLSEESTVLERCSFAASAKRTTCDQYVADREEIALGPLGIGVQYPRKFYYFDGQFDVQLFDGGRYVENMGRGIIYFGLCSEIQE